MTNPLTHFNDEGRARMVDVGEKNITQRIAVATGQVYLQPETMRLIKGGEIKKGDVFIALQGKNFHGNDFVEEALINGAKYIITDQEIGKKKFLNILQINDIEDFSKKLNNKLTLKKS